ncbi:MAG: hypothetical protein ACLPN1_08350 [Dissulfurispiraceae bacterium]
MPAKELKVRQGFLRLRTASREAMGRVFKEPEVGNASPGKHGPGSA